MKNVNLSQGDTSSLFNNIAIEIASKCNRHCYFCPNDYFKRPDVFMEESMVHKVINELVELKYKGRIEWYIYNEPTRDKRLVEFIHYAKQRLPGCCQMINTNGDYFYTAGQIRVLFEAGLNQMQINIYSSSDDSADDAVFANGVRLAEKRAKVLQDMLDSIPQINQGLSLYQNIGSKKWAAQVVKKFGIRKTVKNTDVAGANYFGNRSGNVPGFRDATEEPLKKHCTIPYRLLNINYKGDAVLCCNDYQGTTNFGNITTHTVEQMWNHPALNVYRIKLKSKNRLCYLCDKCDYNGGYYPHMTDTVTTGDPAMDAMIVESHLQQLDELKAMANTLKTTE